MPDISFADGTVISGVPDFPSPEELQALTEHAKQAEIRANPLARNTRPPTPYEGSPEWKNEQDAGAWKQMSPLGKVGEVAKVVGSAVKKTADMPKTMVLGAGGLLAQGGAHIADFLGLSDGNSAEKVGKFLDASQQYRARQDADITPKTGLGQRGSDALTAGLGVFNFGPAASLKNALYGLGIGSAAEGVGSMSNAQGIMGRPDADKMQHEKLLTSLGLGVGIPTTVAGIRSGFGTALNKARVAEDFTDAGLTKSTVDSAWPKMQTAQKHGIDLLTHQALGPDNPMVAAAKTAAGQTGSKTGRAYINQPQQLLDTFGDTAPTMPGNKPGLARMDPYNRGLEQTTNTLEVQTKAGLDAYGKMLKQEATKAYDDAFVGLGNTPIPENAVQKLNNSLENLKGKYRGDTERVKLLERLQEKLTTPEWRDWKAASEKAPKLVDNPDYIALAKTLKGGAANPQFPDFAKKLGIDLKNVKNPVPAEPPRWVTDQLEIANGWRGVKAPHKGTVLTDSTHVQDLNSGALGQADEAFRHELLPYAPGIQAGKTAATNVHETNSWAKNNPLALGKDKSLLDMAQKFERGPLTGKTSGEYTEAAHNLEKGLRHESLGKVSREQNPNALGNIELSQDVNRTILAEVLRKAREAQSVDPGLVSKTLIDTLGRAGSKQNTLTQEVARVAGQQGGTSTKKLEATLQALREKLEIAQMTSERSGAGPLLTERTIKESSTPGWLQGIANFSPVTPFRRVFRAITHGKEGKIADWLDEANYSKAGMDDFTKYLGLPPDKLHQAILANTLSSAHATRNQQRETLDEAKAAQQMNRRVNK